MVYVTGDIHGEIFRITALIRRYELNSNDVIVLLGDTGLNYYGKHIDRRKKQQLEKACVQILCVHGNHDCRPHTIRTYHEAQWHGGVVYVEDEFPHILFAKDGEIYDFDDKKVIVIGGAYSVDKWYRLNAGLKWFSDEQPSAEIKAYVERQLRTNKVDVIFSHTCPYKYIPHEVFLPGIDQSTVDDSTERWLDTIEECTDYMLWFCGHWHTEKHIDKIHFLYRNTEILIDELLISVCQNEYSSAEAPKTYTIDELDAILDECINSVDD